MIPDEIRIYLNSWFNSRESDSSIKSVKPIGGGSINESYRIETGSGPYFLKYNLAERFPGMFAAESKGLNELKTADCINIPDVKLSAETGRYAFLLLDYIQSGVPTNDFWKIFGHQLAKLHLKSNPQFGYFENNYIGSLVQHNQFYSTWPEFLVNERLQPMIKLAVDKGFLNNSDLKKLENMFNKLPGILPVEPPALLHGDLWSGNFMTDKDGLPYIFDPAVYYGHREMDIAMTLLFGGFSPLLYEAYQEVYPMEKGWQERVVVNQLYPLLVHVNLFGSGYAGQVRNILSKY